MSRELLRAADSITGIGSGADRAIGLLGPSARDAVRSSPVGTYLHDARVGRPTVSGSALTAAAGGVVGAILWSEHRWLGLAGGTAIGWNAQSLLFYPEERSSAARNLAQVGAAVAGALVLRRKPVLGFAAGWIAGGAILYAIGGR